MKKIAIFVSAIIMTVALQLAIVSPLTYAAVGIKDVKNDSCGKMNGTIVDGKCQGGNTVMRIFQTVANIILFLVAAVAVIMLIIGGFKFVTANGDANAVTGAKNTIMYAIIGIVVAFLAYAAVNFITTQLEEGAKNEVDCSGMSDAQKNDIRASKNKKCKQ